MSEWLHQFESVMRYHMPAGDLSIPLWPTLGALLAGIVLSLAGAKLLRAAVALCFTGAGVALGSILAERFAFSTIVGVLGGAALFGAIGYLLFRPWMALLCGVIAVVVVAGATTAQDLPAVWQGFEDHRIAAGAVGDEGFAIPTAEAQAAEQTMTLAAYGREFVEYVQQYQPELARKTVVMSALAFAIGFFFGLFFHRVAMVLGTVALGTLLIGGAGLLLGERYWPQAVDRVLAHPRIGLGVAAGWMVLSILTQYRGFRARGAEAPPPAQPQS
jgi:hypothetical protein